MSLNATKRIRCYSLRYSRAESLDLYRTLSLGNQGERVLGNYTTPEGQDEFLDPDLKLTEHGFEPSPEMAEIIDFARRKHGKTFKLDSLVTCIRNLEVKGGKTVFTIGPGRYSESFFTNGSEGVNFDLTDNDLKRLRGLGVNEAETASMRELGEHLKGKYPKAETFRDVVYQYLSRGLPEFGEPIYNNNIGVGGTILTRDGKFVYVDRRKVSTNLGINMTASGGAEFDREKLSKVGVPGYVSSELDRETREELGLKGGALLTGSMQKRIKLELGLDETDYNLVPVGFIRELPRGGKPEAVFLIDFKGDASDLVRAVQNNQHPERIEVGTVYAQERDAAFELLETEGNEKVLQHKAAANLLLIEEYFRRTRKG